MILLNPGPVNLSAGVRAALGGPDLCHREPEYGALQQRVRTGLLSVYDLDGARFAAVLLAGSGTAAVEAMLTSLVPSSARILVLENGAYGERMTAIARAHRIPLLRICAPWDGALDAAEVDAVLERAPDVTHVAVVHHETTTGRLNDLTELAAVCRARGAALLVDAVSSFGAESLPLEEGAIAACAATSNKCLHGAPGVSFVVADRAALERGPIPPRGVYLDLRNHCRMQDERSTAFTPAIPALYALDVALAEHRAAGGWSARHQRYRELAERIARELAKLGVDPFVAAAEASVVLRSYRLPRGGSYARLHDALRARGFVIYAGQGHLAGSIFRISTMGELADADLDRLIDAFRELARAKGGAST